MTACAGGSGTDDETTGVTPTATGTTDIDTGGSSGEVAQTEPGDSGTTGEQGDTTFGCELEAWYPDADEDGYGDVNLPVDACLQPPAHISQGGDCDDANPEVHPGVEEVCDMVDNDCNGLTDELSPANTSCQGCALGLMGTHGYYYCAGPSIRADAELFCQQLGGDLVTIDDQAEQDFLLAEPLPAAPLFYLGLDDLEVEGTFEWPDGSAPGFTAWGENEPNDAMMNEDCVQLSVMTMVWNDIDCANPAAFICEAVGL